MSHPIQEYIGGLFGGVAGIVVGQPFDTVKIRLQTQPGLYAGMLDCCSEIMKKEKFGGFFKGMSSPLIGIGLINALVFGVESQALTAIGNETMYKHFLSGCFAGAVQAFVTSPVELAKTQMQVQGMGTQLSSEKKKYKSSTDAIRKLYKHEGLTRGVYRGFSITLLRDSPAFGIYFASYEFLITYVFPVSQRGLTTLSDTFNTMMSGGFAGVFSWTFTYPIDVVKSCLQADGMQGPNKYKGATDCFIKLYRSDL